MTKFYFHVRQGETLFRDTRGAELPDLRAAWIWAIHDASCVVAEGNSEGPLDEQWIEIADAFGAPVASMPFTRLGDLH